jgi:adenylate cyclase
VVDAVRCAIEVQNGLIERNAGVPEDRRIQFRVGIHVGDVVEKSDGDLMGDGVNIAARLEGIAKPGAICLSEDAYRHVQQRLDLKVTDLGATSLKNIAHTIRVYSLEVGAAAQPTPPAQSQPTVVGAKPRLVRPSALAVVAALLVAVVAVGTYGWKSGLALRLLGRAVNTPHLSMVVLPFTNLSGDPSQDYFADGVT